MDAGPAGSGEGVLGGGHVQASSNVCMKGNACVCIFAGGMQGQLGPGGRLRRGAPRAPGFGSESAECVGVGMNGCLDVLCKCR